MGIKINVTELPEYPSYMQLVESYGLEVIESLMLGSYQGDILMVLRNDSGQFGLLVTGYGSCSGCDALEGCRGKAKELETLRSDLCDSIVWYGCGDFVEYITTKDFKLEYYGQKEMDKLKPFIAAAKEKVLLYGLSGL
jgi:hypothetical protein